MGADADDVLWRRSKLGLLASNAREDRASALHGAGPRMPQNRGDADAGALLAIDQGTTSTRAIVFDAALRPLAIAQQEFRQIYPAPGWVEHDPGRDLVEWS